MLNNKTTLALLAVLIVASCSSDAAPREVTTGVSGRKPVQATGESFDITNDDLSYSMNDNNIIMLPYDPLEPKQVSGDKTVREPNAANKLKSSSFTVLERESLPSGVNANPARRPYLGQVSTAASQGDDAERSGSPNVEKMKDIALNSREVRLVGAEQREVEMKDDLQSKVAVALENLNKEAKEVLEQMNKKLDKTWTDVKKSEVWSQVNEKLDKTWTDVKKAEVWGQVNEKLDKGWTDFKSMVEGVVGPVSSSSSNGNSGR